MKKPKHDELALDHNFWNVISTNIAFQKWFIGKTKFASFDVELVTDEKWHQRWYRDPDTKKDSETDILLMLSDRANGSRYAIHIENKPDHGKWEADQAAKYRKRALNRMSKWRYVDFQVIMLAPLSFADSWPAEAAHFDVVISYEDVSAFVPEFGAVAASSL